VRSTERLSLSAVDVQLTVERTALPVRRWRTTDRRTNGSPRPPRSLSSLSRTGYDTQSSSQSAHFDGRIQIREFFNSIVQLVSRLRDTGL